MGHEPSPLGPPWVWSDNTVGQKMTERHARFIAGLGTAIVIFAVWLFWKSATMLMPPPFLELSPASGYLGLALLATAGVAKMSNRRFAGTVAWLIRAANAVFAFIMTGVIFLLLPINNRDADILYVLLTNGALVCGACLWWCLLHRELSLASKKNA